MNPTPNQITECTDEWQLCEDKAKQLWNDSADEFNQWQSLGKDEKQELIAELNGEEYDN